MTIMSNSEMLVDVELDAKSAAPGCASPLVAIEKEPPARLIVCYPLPEPLARGAAFIAYRAENARIAPIFGKGALQVSPRVAHVHVTVDDARWHFVDTSGETIVVVGLEPGVHKLLIELADPRHRVIDRRSLSFVVRQRAEQRYEEALT